MTLFINEELVDFTLEGKEKAGDVYDSIKEFLSVSNRMIYSFLVDGKETDPEEVHWRDKTLIQIDKIEVIALTESEYRLTGLLTIAEYINFFIRSVSENRLNDLTELLKDYDSISLNITLFVPGEQGLVLKSHFDTVMEKSGLLSGTFNENYKKDFLLEIDKVSELIQSAAREIEDPINELGHAIKAAETLNPDLSEVSLLLQTGKDNEAMKIVVKLTEVLQKIIRLFTIYNTDNIDIEKLNTVLKEMVEAFNAGDSILIGDLLEYEVSPFLEKLSEYFDNLKQKEGK